MNTNTKKQISLEIDTSIACKMNILKNDDMIDLIYNISQKIISCFENKGKLFLFGNGGSASDAIHLAAEFVGGMTEKNRKALPAICLCDNISSITAISNDYGYEYVFAKQIEAFADKNDIALGFSTSGSSKNVIEAFIKSKEKRVITIGFTGENKSKMDECCDYIIKVPSSSTQRIQESHIMIGHIIVGIVEKYFKNK